MSCILRIGSSHEDLVARAEALKLVVDSAWNKDPLREPKKNSSSHGIRVIVSEAEFEDFRTQVDDAVTFLELHASKIAVLVREHEALAVMDFGVAVSGDRLRTHMFPNHLMRLALDAGVALAISPYPET